MVADGSPQHWITSFERVENRALGNGTLDGEHDFAVDLRERAEVEWQRDPDHFNVCTSTERTAGKSRTIGLQRSPLSDEAYTCPPVVPK